MFFLVYRQKVCCGIIYKGRFGEVLIDPHLFKPCCRKKQRQQQQQQQREEEDEDEEEEEEDDEEEVVEEGQVAAGAAEQKSQMEEEVKETPACQENPEAVDLCDPMVALPTSTVVAVEVGWWGKPHAPSPFLLPHISEVILRGFSF